MKKNYLIYALWMAVFLSSNVVSAQNYFGDFPVKADPKTVGKIEYTKKNTCLIN